MKTKKYKKTSIVIVTYKALNYVKRCLDSIKDKTNSPYEFIIIDNNSGEDVVAYLREVDNCHLIENSENRLLTPAQNQGIDILSDDTAYVLFLNPDVEILSDGWLQRMIDLLESNSATGSVGPVCNYHPVAPLMGNIDMCCMMVRRQTLEECGGLDENYPWNGAGFVLTASAWSKGWRYKHLRKPKLIVHHKAKSRAHHHIPNSKIDQYQIMRKFGLKPRWSIVGLFRQMRYRPETLWSAIKEKF